MRRCTALGAVLCVGVTFMAAGCDEVGDAFGGVRGSGNVITETRDVSGFDEIVLLGSGDVVVSVTGTESLMIEAEDNIMPLLTTEVRGGRLELGSKSSFSATQGITYTITAAALQGVEINGSGDVAATGIDAELFAVTINGSGDVEASGMSRELEIGINGSGNYNGEDLVASLGNVDVSGSGFAVVQVTDDLTVSVSGSGAVEYIGDPTLDQSVSGSGDVSQR
jgi:hypothetical protein